MHVTGQEDATSGSATGDERGEVRGDAEGHGTKAKAPRRRKARRKGSRYIPAATKLASALILAFEIPHDVAKKMTRKQLLALVDWHHAVIPFAEGGGVEHWNIMPVLWPEHKEITARETVPQIDKGKRIRLNETKHKEFMRKVKPRKRRAKAKRSRWSRPLRWEKRR